MDPSKFDTWQKVADVIGFHDYVYDLADESHRMDVVQIVLQAYAKLGHK